MQLTRLDPSVAPAATGGYTQGLEVVGASRLVFLSGQIPETANGDIPESFEQQCRHVWANIGAVLAEAGMTTGNLVKVTTFLSDRAFAETNSRIRREVLGDHRPALTVIITGIYDQCWLLEIEAVAAD